MGKDTNYTPVPFIYKSRGLVAREITDRAPEHTYLNLMNCLEREEEAISSRYGTVVVNRDPDGTSGGVNYLFQNPIISLARLLYQALTWRYGGDSAGNLFRRQGDTQGPFSQIYSGLSGNPFTSVITNCFATAQPYLFVYDEDVSIKDSGTGTPTLTGIDPPAYTANSQPYSPLLTLIDNFSVDNTYTSNNFSSAWSFTSVTTLTPFTGQQIVDFSEFIQATYSVSGGKATADATDALPSDTEYFTCAAFPSTATSGQPVTISATALGQFVFIGAGSAYVSLQYSIDSGTTWTTFFTMSATQLGTQGPTTATVSVYGASNLDTVLVRIAASAILSAPSGSEEISAIGTISAITASVNPVGLFGSVANGMISNISTQSSINLAITSITTSTPLVNGRYTQLRIVTQSPHGLTGAYPIGVYGTSNNLCDGFYIASVGGPSVLLIPFLSPVKISATGGFVTGAGSEPASCVLQNLYSTPYPSQFSAWGFYQQVPTSTTAFPIQSWQGTVAQNSVATVGNTITLDLSINNEVTDDDLIVLTLAVGDPAAISSIRLQFDVNSSGFTSSYYYKDISPAYYQSGVQQLEDAYTTTEQQIFADTLGLITGQPPNSTTAQLQPANISTGQGSWLACLLRRGDFVAVGSAGDSGLDWSNITGWQLVITTNTVGSSTVACNGLYLQWGYGPSSFGGVGYDYRYTYLNANTLTESNGSPIQEFDQQFGYLSSLAPPFYLRQAAQVTGPYSQDPQVTHVRIYRRGGIANQNWYQIDQVPNLPTAGVFYYKDVVSDDSILQAQPLILDNDPPVTSSLPVPIATTLALPLSGGGNTYYSTYAPQFIYTANLTGNFVPNQIVQIGYPQNLEEVRVIFSPGPGQFTAIVRLQHNAGEPVNVYSTPRQPCSLSEIAYGQVWLAGDPNNPNYLYFSKKSLPESFGPQNYIPVGSSSGDAITSIVNWRGTLFVKTLTTWWLIIGGAQPYAQPTGCSHGGPAKLGWAITERGVFFRSPDGIRTFQGSQALYISLQVEFIYRDNADTPLPLADPTQASQDIICFFNNDVYISYISQSGLRYRLVWSTVYDRWRIDDVQATAMLWERDTNTFLIAKPLGRGFVICEDYVTTQDYDDGGWFGAGPAAQLAQNPINLNLQPTFQDLNKPHFPKQWNVLQDDVNTSSQPLTTLLQFDYDAEDAIELIPNPNPVTTTTREKVERMIDLGAGQQAYRMSWIHQIAVTTAPIFYQENIYAAELAPYRTSYDTYAIKFNSDESKIVKQGYFDYTSTASIQVSLYADGFAPAATVPYFTFTLPAQASRLVVRQLFRPKKMRLWRLIATSTEPFQLWQNPRIEHKTVREGVGFALYELQGV